MCPDEFALPLTQEPVLLSANFGELRQNHLHSGLDFKTGGVVGKPVVAAADGWVSRISIRKYGYGKAVYLDHANGYTTVYGHLNDLCPRLDSILKDAQYEARSYMQELTFAPGELPVRRGDTIAVSGNTGGSGGPHLHFEVRETASEEPVDPLFWFAPYIKDTTKPRIQALAVYAVPGQGVLSDGRSKAIATGEGMAQALPSVWGRVGLGVKAYDYMDGVGNLMGVQKVRLLVDSQEVFVQEINRFSFDDSRYVNSLTDYGEWTQRKSWIMKSFREEGNRLPVYSTLENDGFIDIDEERDYPCRYELTDRHGNCAAMDFVLHGRRMAVPALDSLPLRMIPSRANSFVAEDIRVSLPAEALYSPVVFRFSQRRPLHPKEPSAVHPRTFSDRYLIHGDETPLHKAVDVRVRIQEDVHRDKSQYYVARLSAQKGLYEYVGGTWESGWMHFPTRDFGQYTVLCDSVAPEIIFPDVAKAAGNGLIRIVIRDRHSGIGGFEGFIDGRWALFEDDYKTESVFYRPDGRALEATGTRHVLRMKVWDNCGNVAERETEFVF